MSASGELARVGCYRAERRSAMSTRRRSTTTMTRPLARSNSVSLVLPLIPAEQKPALLSALRRARSSIPTVETSCVVVSSEYGSSENHGKKGYQKQIVEVGGTDGVGEQVVYCGDFDYPQRKSAMVCALRRAQSAVPAVETFRVLADYGGNHFEHTNKGFYHKQTAEPAVHCGDGEQELSCSDFDYTSCGSSVANLLDVMDEPRRVSKDSLHKMSLSYRWEDLAGDKKLVLSGDLQDTASSRLLERRVSIDAMDLTLALSTSGQLTSQILGKVTVESAYIHDCRTGKSLVSHTELEAAMGALQHWAIQRPNNCCLSYRHDVSGDVATLAWPDMEAGGMEMIEEFVSTINRVEGKVMFFSRYQRSAFDSLKISLSSVSTLSPTAMET